MVNTYTPANAVNRGDLPTGPTGLTDPTGAAWDGQQLVIIDTSGNEVWTLARNTDFSYTPANAVNRGSLPIALGFPTGAAWDGHQLVIVENSGDEVWTLARNTNGSYTPANAVNRGDLPTGPTGLTNPTAATWDGHQLVIIDLAGSEVWTLARNTDFSYTPANAVDQGGGRGFLPPALGFATGAAWDGHQLVIIDTSGNEVWTLARNTDFSYTPANAVNRGSLATGLSDPTGATWGGHQLVIIDAAGDEVWTLAPDNARPMITIAAPTPSTIDQNGTTALVATGVDPGDTLTYAWSSSSGGAFSAQASPSTNWTAPSGITEAYAATLTCTATDSGGLTASASVQVTVREQTSVTLALGTLVDLTGITGDIVDSSIETASGGRTPYVYFFANLPPELGAIGRRIQGRLIKAGTVVVNVTVNDANGDSAIGTFDWTVTGTDITPPTGLNVRIDWGASFFSSPHADVTDRVVSEIEASRGRNIASAVLGRTVAGHCTFSLRNHDGLYDQENMASPLHGQILPGITVQVRNGGEPLWTGVLDSIPTSYDDNREHRAIVTALGLYSALVDVSVYDGSLAPESTALAFCSLLESINEVGVPAPGSTYTVMERWWEQGSMRDALRHIEDTESGFIIEDRRLDFVFQSGAHRTGLAVSQVFSGVNPLGAGEIAIVGRPRREIAVKDVVNTVAGYIRDYEEKADVEVFKLGTPFAINRGTTEDIFVDYEGGGALLTANTPASTTDYLANVDSDGMGSNRTSEIDVATEVSQFNELRISVSYPSSGTDAVVYITKLEVTATVLRALESQKVTRIDAASITRYRPRTLELRDTWISSPAIMRARADTILGLLATPEVRFEFGWYVNDWSDFTSLELSDKIKVKMQSYEADAFIESLRFRIPLSGVLPLVTVQATAATTLP